MEQVGVLFTCDRCGQTLFDETNVQPLIDSNGYRTPPLDWELVSVRCDRVLLCPECFKEYKMLFLAFMGGKSSEDL